MTGLSHQIYSQLKARQARLENFFCDIEVANPKFDKGAYDDEIFS